MSEKSEEEEGKKLLDVISSQSSTNKNDIIKFIDENSLYFPNMGYGVSLNKVMELINEQNEEEDSDDYCDLYQKVRLFLKNDENVFLKFVDLQSLVDNYIFNFFNCGIIDDDISNQDDIILNGLSSLIDDILPPTQTEETKLSYIYDNYYKKIVDDLVKDGLTILSMDENSNEIEGLRFRMNKSIAVAYRFKAINDFDVSLFSKYSALNEDPFQNIIKIFVDEKNDQNPILNDEKACLDELKEIIEIRGFYHQLFIITVMNRLKKNNKENKNSKPKLSTIYQVVINLDEPYMQFLDLFLVQKKALATASCYFLRELKNLSVPGIQIDDDY